jgi:hypothetical protein
VRNIVMEREARDPPCLILVSSASIYKLDCCVELLDALGDKWNVSDVYPMTANLCTIICFGRPVTSKSIVGGTR